jgi:serine/threonine protein kinase
LQDEAELMQLIEHSRIPTYLAHGMVTIDDSESAVLVQEFIEGGDLKNVVQQVMKVGVAIPLSKVIEYMNAICEPLEFMAGLAEPIYHRDLKPHNIIIHPERGPVLIDFGLAKMVSTGEDVSITRGGSGTWTPPERDAGVSGPFTDVYSLGKILYFLLTNKSPPAILDADNIAAITAAGHPQWIGDLTLKAVQPQYNKRIQTVPQFRILLQNKGILPSGETGPDANAASDDFTTWG